MAQAIKRPKILSILGVAWYIISAGQIIAISAPAIRDISSWYPMLYGSIIALRFISIVGIWHMKKWGVELFVYVTIAKIITQVLVGDFGGGAVADSFLSAMLIIIALFYYKRMGRDL